MITSIKIHDIFLSKNAIENMYFKLLTQNLIKNRGYIFIIDSTFLDKKILDVT